MNTALFSAHEKHLFAFLTVAEVKTGSRGRLTDKSNGGRKNPNFSPAESGISLRSTPQTHVCGEQLGSIRRDEALSGAPEPRSTVPAPSGAQK